MIRIDRGIAPDALAPARRKGLARAVLGRRQRNTAPAPNKISIDGYDAPGVRDALYAAQHQKCAYCERQIGNAGQPIEHFRPKQGANLGNPVAGTRRWDADRYWWLAWSWNNLLLACSTCNSQRFKGNWFPIESGATALAIPDGLLDDAHVCFALGLERALLVDPGWDDPLDHIAWRPLDPQRPLGGWRAYHRSVKGEITIHIFGLDGRNVDRVGEHIRHTVHPWVRRIQAALSSNGAEVCALWDEAIRCLFAECQPFHAATHDALDFFIDKPRRELLGLRLERPGAQSPPAAPVRAPAGALPAIWASLPDDVVLEIHAALRSTSELIQLICRSRPSALPDLAAALGLAVPTIRDHCRHLVVAGTLVQDSAGHYTASA